MLYNNFELYEKLSSFFNLSCKEISIIIDRSMQESFNNTPCESTQFWQTFKDLDNTSTLEDIIKMVAKKI